MTYNIKTGKEKILRIWITIIRHGGSGHEVQESWAYLSNATLALRTESRKERIFSSGINCMSV